MVLRLISGIKIQYISDYSLPWIMSSLGNNPQFAMQYIPANQGTMLRRFPVQIRT